MKKIRIFFSAVATLSMIAACDNKEEIEGNGVGFDEATFTVSTISVNKTSATVQTSVTGNTDATYYGFLTEDLTSSPSAVVEKKLATTAVTRHILSTGTTEVTVEGLRPGGKAYRYIVTGLLANGTVYNDPVYVDFETAGDLTNNSAGTITMPNPIAQPTTVAFAGFPGKYVYGYTDDTTFNVAALKKVMNENLDSGTYDSASKDATITFPIQESGSYVAYAYELDENDFPTLSCKIVPFEVGNLDFSAYEAFLGTWYIDGASDATITFAEKEKNMSYYVKGLSLEGLPTSLTEYEDAVAEFDYESKTLIFKEQDLSTFVISSYGDCMKSVTAVFNYGGTNYNYYPFNADAQAVIFTAVANESGNLTVTGGTGDYGAFVGFRYAWYILAGDNAGKGNSSSVITPMPSELTKEPADAPEPSEAYSKWLGTWYDTDGNALVIAQDQVNSTYSVTGFCGDYPAIARFLEDGGIEFYGQTIASTDDGDFVLCGFDQDDYIETGDQDGSARLAKGVISGEGSATVTGCEYVANYGGTDYDETICSLTVLIYTPSEGKYYNYDGRIQIALPATLSTTAPTAVSSANNTTTAFPMTLNGKISTVKTYSWKTR